MRTPTLNDSFDRLNEECLDPIVPLGERHFRRAVCEFVEHYHLERNHQGLGNMLIGGAQARFAADGALAAYWITTNAPHEHLSADEWDITGSVCKPAEEIRNTHSLYIDELHSRRKRR